MTTDLVQVIEATPEEIARAQELRRKRAALSHVYDPRDWYCDHPECDGQPHEGMPGKHARHAQRPPDDWARTIYFRGGRGSGKTKASSQALASLIVEWWEHPGEWAVVAPTAGDARTVCMESGTSGLLVALGASVISGGTITDHGPYVEGYSKTEGTLYLKNGGVVYSDGADDGAYRIQGKNLMALWAEELGLWKKWRAAWDESIRYAVRISPAKIIASGTPKRTMPARVLVKRLLDDDVSLGGRTTNVRLRTIDNAVNLDADTMAEFMASRGTALERQELEGELLDEVEGALWTIAVIDDNRIIPVPADVYDLIQPVRVAVAIDPAVTASETSDETGIIVCAKGADGKGYVLEDLSGVYEVDAWPKVVIDAHQRWQADRVIAEVNNGGDYIGNALRAAGYRGGYESVRATRGKMVRAEPVAIAYSQGRICHVGEFAKLEEQMTTWIPGETADSPDRVDALVWGMTFLGIVSHGSWAIAYGPRPEPDPDDTAERPKKRGWGATYGPKVAA